VSALKPGRAYEHSQPCALQAVARTLSHAGPGLPGVDGLDSMVRPAGARRREARAHDRDQRRRRVSTTATSADPALTARASATGSAAVQIAKKLMGVRRVVAIAGGADKCAWVEALGADVCVDYRAPDFEARLLAATDGFVDTYFDLVGGRGARRCRYQVRRS
jgi:hypothetical protein